MESNISDIPMVARLLLDLDFLDFIVSISAKRSVSESSVPSSSLDFNLLRKEAFFLDDILLLLRGKSFDRFEPPAQHAFFIITYVAKKSKAHQSRLPFALGQE